MECSRGRRRWRWCGRSMLKLAGLCFAVAIICLGGSGCRGSTVLLRSESWRRGRAAASCGNQGCYTNTGGQAQGQWRRLLADGPGSYPPRCTSKCGDCSPCYPVHVAVPPGVPVTTEYYPEAWRCKCGNRLYMP
ncbi:uncharacterized protein [Miscanthus floridulus]|uniref:uncharacterized protein n=1 Tax=Miscanthus floridulus TaxID=154761 RepID=UPI00345A6FE4